jgi:hypothetical protein
VVGAVGRGLDSLPDLTAPEAPGADSDALRRAFDHGAHTLEVGIEGSLRLVIGVTDVMS